MNVSVSPRPAIRFRGRSLLAMVLSPRPPLDAWLADLTQWTARSPGFFHARPVMLDVSGLDLTTGALASLIEELAAHDIRLMGVEGADESLLGPGMPPLIGGGVEASLPEPVPANRGAATATPVAPPPARSLIHDAPVRSGQSVVHAQGDVTIVGSVASGAEIIAGGSIHIYGTLRGRAIAGVTGNPRAKIFCTRLEAELLAIDGLYRSADDIDPEYRNRGIRAWLDGDALRIAMLN